MNSVKYPVISVLMPVFNGSRFIAEAIDSILNQTYTHFEFIIIDDGSTDNTVEIIKSYDDKRIILSGNECNLGIAETLNKGLLLAKGEYIARMDADDVAMPHRLAIQLEYIQLHPEVTVCGSYLQVYEQPEKIWKPPTKNEVIKTRLLFENCLCHPTVIFKKDMILDNQEGYDPYFLGSQDYDLWQRLSNTPNIHFANIPEVLLRYRLHPNDDKTEYTAMQQKLANLVRRNQLRELGIILSKQEFSTHETLSYYDISSFKLADLKHYQQWLDRIEQANIQQAIYSPIFLKKELEYRWLKLCLQVSVHHPFVVIKYLLSHWSPIKPYSIYLACRILWRSRKSWGKGNE